MKFHRLLIIILLAPLLFAAKPKFSDTQIIAMTPHYFDRNHTSPKLLGVNIYTTRQGRVYQVDIQVDRNRINDDLGFAYSALTNMGQYAKKTIKQLIVVMHSDNHRKKQNAVSISGFIKKENIKTGIRIVSILKNCNAHG